MWRDGQWRWGEGSAHLMNSHWRLFMLWRVKKKYYIRGGNRSVVTVQAAANGIDQVEEMKMKDTLITQWTPSTPVSLLLEQKHMIINYSHISFPSRMTKQAVTTLKSVTNSVTFIYFRSFLTFAAIPEHHIVKQKQRRDSNHHWGRKQNRERVWIQPELKSKVQKSRLMEIEGENSGSFTRADSLMRHESTEEGRETDKGRKWRVKHEQVSYTIKPVTRTSRFLFIQAADGVVWMKTNRDADAFYQRVAWINITDMKNTWETRKPEPGQRTAGERGATGQNFLCDSSCCGVAGSAEEPLRCSRSGRELLLWRTRAELFSLLLRSLIQLLFYQLFITLFKWASQGRSGLTYRTCRTEHEEWLWRLWGELFHYIRDSYEWLELLS